MIGDTMEILLKGDVMNMLRISEATLYRWLSESRTGLGTFPLPVSQPGKTLRWNSDDVDQWCQSKAVAAPKPVKQRKPPAEKQQQKQDALQSLAKKYKLS